jgi:hypothetical protein
MAKHPTAAETKKKKKKWNLGESNPILLRKCSIAYDAFDAAVHCTPGPFPPFN